MRAMYAIYNNKVYEELNQRLSPDGLVYADSTHMETSKEPKDGVLKVDINIVSDSKRNKTNGALFTTASELIKENKIKYLDKLDNKYRVYVEFELYDELADEVIDSGFVVKDVKPSLKMRPLYLTKPANEFVSAFPLSITSHVRRYFRTSVPYGLSAKKKDSYVFKISSISIRQAKVSAFLAKVDQPHRRKPHHHLSGNLDLNHFHHGHVPPHCHEYESECDENAFYYMSGMNGSDSFIRNSIEIYSSISDHLEFKPVYFKFSPREIAVDINFMIDGLFVVHDYTDIEDLLKENRKSPEIKPEQPDDKDDDIPDITDPDEDDPEQRPEIPDGSDENDTEQNPDEGDDAGKEPPSGNEDQTPTQPNPPFTENGAGEVEIDDLL